MENHRVLVELNQKTRFLIQGSSRQAQKLLSNNPVLNTYILHYVISVFEKKNCYSQADARMNKASIIQYKF